MGYDFLAYTPAAASEAGYPASNLADYDYPRKLWKGTADSVVLDFGAAKTVTYVCLNNANFLSALIEGNAADAWGDPSFSTDRNLAADYRVDRIKGIIELTAFNYRYMRFTFSDFQGGDTAPSLGNIIIPQTVIQFAKQPTFGYEIAVETFEDAAKFKGGGEVITDLSGQNLARAIATMDFNRYPKANESDLCALRMRSMPLIFWENFTPVASGNMVYLGNIAKSVSVRWDAAGYVSGQLTIQEKV